MIPAQRFLRAIPESQNVSSSQLLQFIEALAASPYEVHSLMLVRHHRVVAEGWWAPYGPELPHMLFSLSKSFTATALGLALGEGRLTLDDPVLSFFPAEERTVSHPHLRAMRVRHLITMSTGHTRDPIAELLQQGGDHWTHGFFQCPPDKAPGTHFLYNNAATYLLGAIVQGVTGQNLLDYLTPRCLAPLGIDGAVWETSPEGINLGFSGLRIRTEDIAAFGQLYLNQGLWQGRRLLPVEWVREATRAQVANGTDPDSDWSQGYGYQFWRCRHAAYRGDGAYGQFCLVMPERDAVLVITSGINNMQGLLNLVWRHVLPALSSRPLPNDPSSQAELISRLPKLGLDAMPPSPLTISLAAIRGRYRLAPNQSAVAALTLTPTPDGHLHLEVETDKTTAGVVCGVGAYQPGTFPSLIWDHLLNEPVLALAEGDENQGLKITLRFFQSPFTEHLTLSWPDPHTLQVAVTRNVDPATRRIWTGVRE